MTPPAPTSPTFWFPGMSFRLCSRCTTMACVVSHDICAESDHDAPLTTFSPKSRANWLRYGAASLHTYLKEELP
jgi:hypothetical protein